MASEVNPFLKNSDSTGSMKPSRLSRSGRPGRPSPSYSGHHARADSLPAPSLDDSVLPSVPMPPVPVMPASRPDWQQQTVAQQRPERGLRARKTRVQRPGSNGVGARSTMEMVYRESAQARAASGQSMPIGSPVTDVDYDFEPVGPTTQAGLPAAPASSFDSLDEFVDLSKPSRFKRGTGKKNMLKGHDRSKGAATGRPTVSRSAAGQMSSGKSAVSTQQRPLALGGLDAPTLGASPVTAVKLFYKKYARFAGRASKSEFWWVVLWLALAPIMLMLVPFVGPVLSGLLMLASIVPGLALMFRRAHDADKPILPWACIAASILSTCTTAVTIVQAVASIAAGSTPDLGLMAVLSSLLGLTQFVAFLLIGFSPSKPTGARFDKKWRQTASGMKTVGRL